MRGVLYDYAVHQYSANLAPSITTQLPTQVYSGLKAWNRGNKIFFMLNSAEHEIFSANKYEYANNSLHFHNY